MSLSAETHESEAGEVPAAVKWTVRDVVIGLSVLLGFRCLSFLGPHAVAATPKWLLLAASTILPQAFFVAYPVIVARRRGFGSAFRWPGANRALVEFVVSIPFVIGIVGVLMATSLVLSRVAPNTTLTPEAIQRAAAAPTISFVVFFVVAATLIAPICEEIFFRGFLQSALRMRMPVFVAGLVQSAIFALGHTFGLVHGVAVFILGLILTTACVWRKSLLTSVFVHAGNNLVASLGFIALVILNANSPVLGILGHDHSRGCQVDQVLPQSGASQAGMAFGDVVTKLNGEPVTGFLPMRNLLRQHRAGETVTLSVLRDGEPLDVKVVLQKRPASP